MFDNPKPHNLIKQLLEFVTDDGDVIVDFFRVQLQQAIRLCLQTMNSILRESLF